MQSLLGCFQPFAASALVFAPFGIPKTPFWMYVSAAVVLVAGLIRVVAELPREQGVDKIMPFGRLFYAIPMAVFASEHFTLTKNIAAMVPRWMPWHTFWAYLVGGAFFAAALGIATLVEARLAAALLGMTFLIFVVSMDLPGAVTHPSNRFFWALALRELAFSGGALAFAIRPTLPKTVRVGHPRWMIFPRVFIGIAALFYGVESLLHPEFVPVIPLSKVTPAWIPGRIALTYFVGAILIAAGVCLLVNKRARLAATYLGLTILLAMVWVYLPMLAAAPKDLVALNYFFDTLLFCGTTLLLANAIPKGSSEELRRSQTQGE